MRMTALKRNRFGPLAGLLMAGALFALWPREGAAIGVVAWSMTLALMLPEDLRVAAPLLALLSFPADYVAGLDGPAHGFLVLAATLGLSVVSVIRWGFSSPRKEDWDLYLLIGVLCGATVLHAASGELRGILFWLGAGVFLWWLRGEERGGIDARGQVVLAILGAGALGGIVAVAERLHVLDVARLIPGYEPHVLDFSAESGTRAAALSGHPLRFGTLSMVASIFALTHVMDDQLPARSRRFHAVVLGLCLLGLVLSGARGSWLGFSASILAYLLFRAASGHWSSAGKILTYAAAAVALVWVTGLSELIRSRLVGTASHPGSINQRMLVLEGIRYVWGQVPLFGVGFGGAAEMGMRMGLKLLNLENEYLRFFFTAGFAGPLVLLIVGVRRVGHAVVRLAGSPIRIGVVCAIPAVLVNVATYNMFSWSMGPPILAALAFLALPLPSHRLIVSDRGREG